MDVGMFKDYYSLLGVAKNATVSEIHKAYWQRASLCHPDRGGSHEEMVQLVEAWRILSDPEKRSRYDQLRAYSHDGWRSRKFNADVHDARTHAEGDATSSWAEFEEIYQKAFYTFNQDFYGEDIDKKAAGPYSPLMVSKEARKDRAEKSRPSEKSPIFAFLMKTVILFIAVVAALVFYRNYLNVGRYVPLGQQDTSHTLVLDTTNGTVYSVEKQDGSLAALLKHLKQTHLPPDKQKRIEK